MDPTQNTQNTPTVPETPTQPVEVPAPQSPYVAPEVSPVTSVTPTESPVSTSIVEPPQPGFSTPKKGLKGIIGLVLGLLLLFIIAGAAYATYAVAYEKIKLTKYPDIQKKVSEFVISLPFMPKTPKYLLARSGYVHQSVTKESFDISVAVDSKDIASAMGLSGLDMAAKGSVDYSDTKNIKIVVNGSLTKDFNAELIKLDKILYFRINKIPQVFLTAMGFKSGDFDPLLGKWVSYDTTPLDTEARKSIQDKEVDPLSKEYVDEEFQKYLDEEVLSKMKIEAVKDDGFDVYKITLVADAALIDHLGEKLDQASTKSEKTLRTLGAKTQKLSEIVKSLSWQIDIDRKDFYMRKMIIKSDIEADSLDTGSFLMGNSSTLNQKSQAKIAFAAKFSNFGEAIKEKAPEGAMTTEEFLNKISEIVQKTYTSSYSGASSIASSRDAKRQADLQSLRSGLELYNADFKKYPKTTEDLKGSYLASIPKDPLGTDYYYSVANDQKSYDLCANLESVNEALLKPCPNPLYNFGVKNP